MTDHSFVFELYSVIHAARLRTRWSVLVVPKVKYELALETISALSDVPFYGRTILWPDTNRKLTVVHSGMPIFVPKGEYDLFLAGWGREETKDASLLTWKESAREFVPTSDATFSVFSLRDPPKRIESPLL